MEIGRGVRKRCCTTLSLFNLYGECLVKGELEELGGRWINIIKYADVILATDGLQNMINRLVNVGRKCGMESKRGEIKKDDDIETTNVYVLGQKLLRSVQHFKFFLKPDYRRREIWKRN